MFIGITSPDQGRSELITAVLNIQATYKINAVSAAVRYKGTESRSLKAGLRTIKKFTCSSSYDGSSSSVSYVCASQFYDAFSFFRKAYK